MHVGVCVGQTKVSDSLKLKLHGLESGTTRLTTETGSSASNSSN